MTSGPFFIPRTADPKEAEHGSRNSTYPKKSRYL